MPVTFDGINKLILVNSGTLSVDVTVDLYSGWKEWVIQSDNAKYLQALSAVGGDPLSDIENLDGSYFLLNGWRVRPWEGDFRLQVVGNFFTEEGESPFIPTTGSHNVLIELKTSAVVRQLVTSGSGGGGFTDSDRTVLNNISSLVNNMPSAVSSSVWNAINTNHNTSGTFGSIIDLIFSGSGGGSGGDGTLTANTIAAISSSVWNAVFSDHNITGTMGFLQGLIDNINSTTNNSFVIINSNLDTAVSTRSTPGDQMDLLPNTVSFITSSIWEAFGYNHVTSGTMGWFVQQVIDTLISGSGVEISSSSIDQLVNVIWDEPMNEHNVSGTVGWFQSFLDNINSTTNNSYQIVNSNLDIPVSTRAVSGDEMQLTPNTISSISSSVWNSLELNHTTSGTMGWLLGQLNELTFSGSVNLTSGTITDLVNAIWDEPSSEHNITGTIGFFQSLLDNINSTTNNSYQIINSNLDVPVSTRAVSGDEMQLTPNTISSISSSVWNALDSSHTTSGTMGYLINLVDEIDVKSSSSFDLISTEGVFISSSSINTIVDSVWDEPIAEHNISGSTARVLATAGAGGVDTNLLADAVWSRDASLNTAEGTFGGIVNNLSQSVQFIRGMTAGRWEINGSQMIFYAEDNVTELARYNLTDTEGDPFFSAPNAPAERTKV